MNSPGICIHSGKNWSIQNCEFFFLTGNKKIACEYKIDSIKITGILFEDYVTDLERFYKNAACLRSIINPDQDTKIVFEGYAFGASGSRIFQIGESTGIAKMMQLFDPSGALINSGNNLQVVPPMTIKKFATGKGNADKQLMYQKFLEETGIDISAKMGFVKLGSPVHDIVDAYWISKYCCTAM